MSQETWDRFFIDGAQWAATKSKDRSRKIGCVIVGPDNEVRSVGFNGFPRGINDNIDCRHQRPEKYRWTCHAEKNAIDNAARAGIRTEGCVLYVQWMPCSECAKSIIQCGITSLVGLERDNEDPQWVDDMKHARAMLEEAGVVVRYYCEGTGS